jgi:hypothetical protein
MTQYYELELFINNSKEIVVIVIDGKRKTFTPQQAHEFILEHITEYEFTISNDEIIVSLIEV